MSAQPTTNASASGEESVAEQLNALFSVMFTKASIEADEYMVANMQPNTAFSLDVICSNPKIREITTDEAVVEAALAAAPAVEYANRTARPKLRVEQHSIILRDIPPEVPREDILKIFEDAAPTADGVPCPRATAARSDLNNTWFVSFASEADTRQALACVRSSRFNGSSVKARLKTESLNKAFYATADRYGPGTPGSASSVGTAGDFYSPGGPMMMQPGMYYGYPAPGAFMPPPPGGYPGMSPMGMGPGMWGGPQVSPGGMGGMMPGAQGYHQNNRHGPQGGKGGPMQQNNRNNRNNQRVSPRNPQQGRGYQGQYEPNQGERLTNAPADGPDGPATSDSAHAMYGNVEEGEEAQRYAATPRYSNANGQQMNRRQGQEQGRRAPDGQQQAGQPKKKGNAAAGAAAGAPNPNQTQNKKNKSTDPQAPGKAAPAGAKGAPQKAGGAPVDGRRKTNPRGAAAQDAPQKGPNFNLNAADFPAAWDDSTAGRAAGQSGGQKGSWTAALLGGSKAGSEAGPVPGGQPMSDAGSAAKAMFSGEDHHSILVNSSFEKRERHHSFSSDQHISFVADAVDEPSHLHRVPTPIPTAEEVIETWQNDAQGGSPPPLHVNDTVEERHSHRIVPGTQVAKEMETLIFGSFKTPVGDDAAVVEENTSANTHPAPAAADATPAPAPAPGGKRSFMDVLKASKK